MVRVRVGDDPCYRCWEKTSGRLGWLIHFFVLCDACMGFLCRDDEFRPSACGNSAKRDQSSFVFSSFSWELFFGREEN